MTPAEQRAADLTRAYATIVLPDEVVADMDAKCYVAKGTLSLDSTGRVDPAMTLWCEGARVTWMIFRDRVAAAKRPRPPEPPPTHAVSSTARMP